jgi:predicted RNA-binding protein YlqC (UPF0109 family)
MGPLDQIFSCTEENAQMSEPSAIAAKADPKTLVEQIAKALVSDPEEVSVESFEEDGETVLELRVSPQSVGKIIGRSGRTVRAIRALVSAVSEKLDHRYTLDVIE